MKKRPEKSGRRPCVSLRYVNVVDGVIHYLFYWPMLSAANSFLSFILGLRFSDGLLLLRIGIVAQVFFQAL